MFASKQTVGDHTVTALLNVSLGLHSPELYFDTGYKNMYPAGDNVYTINGSISTIGRFAMFADIETGGKHYNFDCAYNLGAFVGHQPNTYDYFALLNNETLLAVGLGNNNPSLIGSIGFRALVADNGYEFWFQPGQAGLVYNSYPCEVFRWNANRTYAYLIPEPRIEAIILTFMCLCLMRTK